jgi:hypothetical protein
VPLLANNDGMKAVVATQGTGDFGGKGGATPFEGWTCLLPSGAAAENQRFDPDSEEMCRLPETGFGDRRGLSGRLGGAQGP